jgi:hypothetical protein
MTQAAPSTPDLAELDYPKATKALIKIMNEKMSVYAEADTQFAELEDNITNAKYQDALALKAAAIAGEPDPGTASTEAATRAVLYQTEVVRHAHREATKAGAAVTQSIEENKLEILELALNKAEAGILAWQQSVVQLQHTYSVEESNRQSALDGLKMMSKLRLTNEKIQFDSVFPVAGILQVPKTREDQVLGITVLLRKMFLDDTPEPEVETKKGPHLIHYRR